MAVRDNSRLSGLFDDSMDMRLDSLDDFRTDRSMIKYTDKLRNSNFEEFNHRDWRKYFVSKAKENGVPFISSNSSKDKSIFESLMGNFTARTIKDMIDFVWECDHNLKQKEIIGSWILSKGWIQTVYSLTLKWKAGEDISGKKPREWREVKSDKVKKVSKFSIRSDED